MFHLDTDTLSNFLDKRRAYDRLRQRIALKPSNEICISVVTLEEMLRGTLDLIRQAQSTRKSTAGPFTLLAHLFQDLRVIRIIPFTEQDEDIFNAMPPSAKRAGANDCRIAASAISRGLTVITGNLAHFQKIAGVKFEDWSS